MAETNVAITAGSGTNIATYTDTASNRRQVIIIGDSAAAIAPVDNTKGLAVDLAASGTLANVTTVGTVSAVTTVSTVTAVTNVATIGTSVTPGTSAAHLGKAEDAAHSSGDTGVMLLTVRSDSAASTAGTTGDYAALTTDDTGRLYTTVQNITPGTAATALGKAEDAAHTSADVGVMVLGIRSDTTPASTSGTAGDYSGINIDGNGRVYVNATLYSAAGAALTPDTQGTQDGALGTITSVSGSMTMGRASTAAPSAVSADDDAVLPWYTKEGKAVVTTSPHTAGGLSTFMASGSDGSTILQATAQAVKSSAGQLYGYYAYNPEAAVSFVHFYNTAQASVTVGTTNPMFTIALPAGAAANMTFPFGVTFSNAGWSAAATTTAGGNTNPATGVSLVAWYA
jgi:hypothetical protein